MSHPGPEDDFSFTFDVGDGVPVSTLGELDDATDDEEEREGAVFPDMDDRDEPYMVPLPGEGGTSQPRPTGSGQAPPVVTAVEQQDEGDATPEELERAWNALTDAQRANYAARPYLWAPGAAGHPRKAKPKAEREKRKQRKSNRINVRDVVDGIVGKSGLDPFSVMALLMVNTDEARTKLGLTERERPSLMLRAKCAFELAGYMSPKLKSIEIKDEGHKPAQVQVFLPANGREEEQTAVLRLPVKDGAPIELSPDTAAQLIRDGHVEVPDEDQEE